MEGNTEAPKPVEPVQKQPDRRIEGRRVKGRLERMRRTSNAVREGLGLPEEATGGVLKKLYGEKSEQPEQPTE